MADEVTNAVVQVQAIVAALTSVTFKSRPTYPIENADPFPMSIVYMSGGNLIASNKSTAHIFPTIRAEFHFSRANLQDVYPTIYNVAIEFARRLAGNPTLTGTVDTIVATNDAQLPFEARPFDWGKVVSEALIFEIPLKLLKAPITP